MEDIFNVLISFAQAAQYSRFCPKFVYYEKELNLGRPNGDMFVPATSRQK